MTFFLSLAFPLKQDNKQIMTQFLNRLPSQCGLHILCGYQNQTPKVQIMRISNIPNWYFERLPVRAFEKRLEQ